MLSRAARRAGGALLPAAGLLALSLGLLSAPSCGRFALPGGELGGSAGPPDPTPGPPPPDLPPTPAPAQEVLLGLTAAVGGEGVLRVDWLVPPADLETPPEFALYLAVAPADPFAGSPLEVDPKVGTALLEGLPIGQLLRVGLGARTPDEGDFTPVGPVLSVHTGRPLFVDPAGPGGLGDGSSPQDATPDLLLAVLLSFSFGGGNVWVAEGQLANLGLPLFEGVHLTGGFPPGFDLAARDPAQHSTLLTGLDALPIVSVSTGVATAVLAGFTLDGLGVAQAAVDVVGAPFEGRELTVRACRRGVKARTAPEGPKVALQLLGCDIVGSVLQGVSLDGAFDVELDRCAVAGSGQEGVDFAKWYAPSGVTVRGRVRGCGMLLNAGEGLDIDLAAPPDAPPPGGRFDLEVESSSFQINSGAGLLIDIDYETAPEWTADLSVRGVRARANLGPGIDLDLDSSATAFLHRVSCTANGGAGLLATSESAAGMLVVSSSVLAGNRGAGLRTSLGNFGALVSHCVVSGNLEAGVQAALAPAGVVSSVAHVQPAPWSGASVLASVAQEAASPLVHVRAAGEFRDAVAVEGATLTLDVPQSGGVGTPLEVLDDGVERTVVALGAGTVSVDPEPGPVPLPSRVAFFPPGVGVLEDYRLAPGSVALGAGLAPPGGALVDAGPYGAPSGGAPGVEAPLVRPAFRLGRVTPPWTLPVPAQAELALEFVGGAPDAATLAGVRAVDAGGVELPLVPYVSAGVVRVPAPGGGWPAGARLLLTPPLASTGGVTLVAPVAVPLAQ